jgi:hypothetical protein
MRHVWSESKRSRLKIRGKHGPHGSGREGMRRSAKSSDQGLRVTNDSLSSCYPPFDTIQSPMQEVSRKRPHLDSEPLPSKKRAVSVNGTTVPVNGTVIPTAAEDEEPRDQDSLEVDFMLSFPTRSYMACFSFSAIPQGGYFPSHEALLARK